MSAPLLELDDVTVDYTTRTRRTSAVSGVSLQLQPGEKFGLVGESGCGKTTLSMAIMGLLPASAQVSGHIRFQGQDVVRMPEADRRRIRGNTMSMVFQDPATSLDPTFSIGSQIAETLRAHRKMTAAQAREQATRLLADVGIPDPAGRYDDPPHRLSGGMRQRIVIGAALANDPALLVADEPTTALDVTIQAQILELLSSLVDRLGSTVLLIAHDLGVVAQFCDRVGVMYAGQLVEVAPVEELFSAPQHPYTRALLAALPRRGAQQLEVIDGAVPDLSQPPAGCRFADRCAHRMDVCATTPPLIASGDRAVACWWKETDDA